MIIVEPVAYSILVLVNIGELTLVEKGFANVNARRFAGARTTAGRIPFVDPVNEDIDVEIARSIRLMDFGKVYMGAVNVDTVNVNVVVFEKLRKFKIDEDLLGSDHPVAFEVVNADSGKFETVKPEHTETFHG